MEVFLICSTFWVRGLIFGVFVGWVVVDVVDVVSTVSSSDAALWVPLKLFRIPS